MEKQIQPTNDWYKEFKEKQLDSDIKRCNAFATVSGVVASISALVVAGNIVVGNSLEALQVGGATAAMFGYAICYSKMGDTYKLEKKSLEKLSTASLTKNKLESLKSQLEIAETQLSLNYLVGGSFITSAIAHVIELLTIPSAPEMITSVTCASLAALVGALNFMVTKRQKTRIALNKEQISSLEEEYELEEQSKQPIPELVEPEAILELDAPSEEEQPKILQLEEITKKK